MVNDIDLGWQETRVMLVTPKLRQFIKWSVADVRAIICARSIVSGKLI